MSKLGPTLFVLPYVVVLIGAFAAALALAVGRFAGARLVWASCMLAALCAFAGVPVALVAGPDWSFVTAFFYYLPFWTIAVWAAAFAWLNARKLPAKPAALVALCLAVGGIAISPVAVPLLVVLWAPAAVASVVMLVLRRPTVGAPPRCAS